MATKEFILKLREDRLAKEKARIQKLRDLNLKKYGQNDASTSTVKNLPGSLPLKSKSTSMIKNTTNYKPINNNPKPLTNNIPAKTLTKQPSTTHSLSSNKGPGMRQSSAGTNSAIQKYTANKISQNPTQPRIVPSSSKINNNTKKSNDSHIGKPNLKLHKCNSLPVQSKRESRASYIPKASCQNTRESVFDRLYKPKIVHKSTVDATEKIRNDPSYLKKIISSSNLITNRRCTTFEVNTKEPTRRSLSAVHLKKISKSEIKNCIHKWSSVGEKLNKECIKEINEDDNVQDDKVVSAVKSERKKVKFQTPMQNPEEMLSKLNKWLHLKGKSIDSYPHLKCFGVPRSEFMPNIDYDDENKENVALEHDSDNESFIEMNGNNTLGTETWKNKEMDKWRSPSCVDSVDFNESYQTTMTSEMSPREDELLLGALNHLTELLRSGYNWDECARWLRAIRERVSQAQDTAAYWECRAALEERRGDLPASMECWEQAIAKGAEQALVEVSLDQLLDKFMQLKISPGSGKKPVDPKLVDAKNVFKSTLIRFAVQEAKNNLSACKATVTPVRRSTRVSCYRRETPLKLFNTIQQAIESEHAEFKPNKMISGTP